MLDLDNQTTFATVRTDAALWGRQVESAVGSYLLSVDFILQRGLSVVAIEVKSNNASTNAGLHFFSNKYKPLQAFVVGNEGIPLADFLQTDLRLLFR